MLPISPLVPLAASLILGIVWQATDTTPWLVCIFMSLVTITFFAYKQHSRFLILTTLSICFFMAGALRYAHQKTYFEQRINTLANKSCTVIATIDDKEPSFRKPDQTVMTVTLQEAHNYEHQIESAAGLQLKLYTRQNCDHLRTGDTIQCTKIFLRESTNEDYTRYLIKENIAGQVFTNQPITLLHRPAYSVNRWLVEKRNQIMEHTQKKLSPLTFTLFASIFWGKKELNPYHMESVKDNFKIWGLLHYLARSGLHVLLFILLWNWLFTFLPFSFNFKQLLLALIIIGYHLLSWPSISFIRSIILFVFYKICLLSDLQINILHLLALTCIFVLLINPFQLFFLDFQLSFGLTFALAWLSLLQKS